MARLVQEKKTFIELLMQQKHFLAIIEKLDSILKV